MSDHTYKIVAFAHASSNETEWFVERNDGLMIAGPLPYEAAYVVWMGRASKSQLDKPASLEIRKGAPPLMLSRIARLEGLIYWISRVASDPGFNPDMAFRRIVEECSKALKEGDKKNGA